MPVKTSEAVTGADGFLFPDDLEGVVFQLQRDALYTAYEVRKEEHQDPLENDHDAQAEGQVPAYGRWYPVDVRGRDDIDWMIAPGELVEELKTYEDPAGAPLRVTRCKKSGPGESDPFEVNVAPAPES